MRYRKLDANNDMTFGSSAQNFLVNSPAAVAQVVTTALKLFLGEWYLNLNDGVPYPEGILGNHSKETADQTLISYIKSLTGVTGLTNWESTYEPATRTYTSIGATLYTQYGETQLQIDNRGNF